MLCIDQDRVGLDFVLRACEAGHEVRWFRYVKPGRECRDGEGFKGFTIVPEWEPHMKWAKEGLIYVANNSRYLTQLDRYREFGYCIFGPTSKSAELEIVRQKGMAAMEAAGIEVPAYQTFKSLGEAEAFARKSDKAWVFKTLGDNEDKSLSFVAKDPAQLVGWLHSKIAEGVNVKGPVMLQEKIDMAAELGVSGWVGPEGFLPDKWQICFEHKKLMDGEIGPNTGEQGSLCQYVEKDKMATEMLLPMEPVLRALGHIGDFAIGCGVDSKGKAWPFEFTARCGYPAWWIQVASHKGDPVQWMKDLCLGRDTLRVDYRPAIGVVMAQPPYPYDEACIVAPISGLDESNIDSVHLVSAMIGRGPVMVDKKVVDGPCIKTTAEYVLCATGHGRTVELARRAVYRVVAAIKFPDALYRTDIGEKVESVLPKLHSWGYAKDMQYK